MEIFIDESGKFVLNDNISVACALSIPTQFVNRVRRELTQASIKWPKLNGELKGGQLGHDELRILVDILFRRDALLHVCAIDVAGENAQEVAAHQAKQAELITAALTPRHHPNLVGQINALRKQLENMPSQLYIQSKIMSELVCSVTEENAFYFAQRKPKEIAKFNWHIDAKDPMRVTAQEKWWRDTLGPLLESRSERIPFKVVRDESFDYSFFDKTYSMKKGLWRPDDSRREVVGYDIKKMVVEGLNFVDSRSDILIQAIDIMCSFVRRVLNGKIKDIRIIMSLGRLQIKIKRNGRLQSVQFLSLSSSSTTTARMGVLTLMTRSARAMMK